MATQFLDLTPFPGATFRDEFEALDSFMEDGPGEERVLVADGLARRVYSWPTADFPEDARIRAAFLAARNLAGEAFYVIDPWETLPEGFTRVDVDVGPATNGQTVFSLPTDRDVEAFRDWPISGQVFATVAGAPRGVASVDTDARTITLASSCTAGQSVKLTYRAYRLVRIAPSVQWTADDADWYATSLELREVLGPR